MSAQSISFGHSQLPPEISLLIFKLLTVTELQICSKICKTWRNFIINESTTFRDQWNKAILYQPENTWLRETYEELKSIPKENSALTDRKRIVQKILDNDAQWLMSEKIFMCALSNGHLTICESLIPRLKTTTRLHQGLKVAIQHGYHQLVEKILSQLVPPPDNKICIHVKHPKNEEEALYLHGDVGCADEDLRYWKKGYPFKHVKGNQWQIILFPSTNLKTCFDCRPAIHLKNGTVRWSKEKSYLVTAGTEMTISPEFE
jgi:hypothetical protein